MQSPAPFDQPWVPQAPQVPQKTNGTAIFAFIASVFSYFCFAGIGGALGIVLGLIARSEIAKSEGRESGRGLANGAIGLGVVNLTLSVVALGVGIAYLATEAHAVPASPAVTSPMPGFVAPPAPPPAKSGSRKREAKVSRARGTEVTAIGAIEVADIVGDFDTELGSQRLAADAAGEALVLWVVVHDCKPCDGVAAALTSPLSQKALGKTRFVRVDRDEYQIELERLGVPTEKIPGFALLDARNHVRDFIHGGEWDADIAVNIAPILGKFVHGAYRQRRHPWSGGAREDETPI